MRFSVDLERDWNSETSHRYTNGLVKSFECRIYNLNPRRAIMTNLRESILKSASVYSKFQKFLGNDSVRRIVEEYIPCNGNEVILDIGCGPATILEYLPKNVDYYGFDLSERYIQKAKTKYSRRNAVFSQEAVSEFTLPKELVSRCNYVWLLGVLHHLSDAEVKCNLELAEKALKKGGKLFCIDTCYVKNQNLIAKTLAALDRGKYIRQYEKYESLFSDTLGDNFTLTIRNDLLIIPYTHLIAEYIK